MSADFTGGSAKVLKLDPAGNTVGITPADDPKRGWPCWWYFRLDNVDTGKPVVLEVTANQGAVRDGDIDNTRRLSLLIPSRSMRHTRPTEQIGNTRREAKSKATEAFIASMPPHPHCGSHGATIYFEGCRPIDSEDLRSLSLRQKFCAGDLKSVLGFLV
jgi:hypothetical protein